MTNDQMKLFQYDVFPQIPDGSSQILWKKKLTFQYQVLAHLLTTMKPFTLKTFAAKLKMTDVALCHLMLSLLDKGIVWKK